MVSCGGGGWCFHFIIVDLHQSNMSKKPQLRLLGAESQSQETINWKLCILCQSDAKSKGQLVLEPRLDSYQKIIDTVKKRASLNDGYYVEMQRRLKDIKTEALCENKAFWHRSCYLEATHKVVQFLM